MVWLAREGTSARRSVGGVGEREGGRGRIRNSETCLFHTSYCLPRLPFHCLLLSRPSLFQQHVLPYHSVSYITAKLYTLPFVTDISRIFYVQKVAQSLPDRTPIASFFAYYVHSYDYSIIGDAITFVEIPLSFIYDRLIIALTPIEMFYDFNVSVRVIKGGRHSGETTQERSVER